MFLIDFICPVELLYNHPPVCKKIYTWWFHKVIGKELIELVLCFGDKKADAQAPFVHSAAIMIVAYLLP